MKKPLECLLVLLFFNLCVNVEIYSQIADYHTLKYDNIKYEFNRTTKRNSHPRLFFNLDDIQRIKSLIEQKDALALLAYNQLKAQAEWTMSRPMYQYRLDADSLRIYSIHDFSTLIPSLVLMYHLTGDEKYAAHCVRQMELMATYPEFGANRHFLDTGIAGFNFALVYDGLYSYLNNKQKKVLKKAVMEKVLKPASLQMNDTKADWHTRSDNWNGVCNGGLIMAALALFEDDQSFLSSVVAKAANKLPNYLQSFSSEGQTPEGQSYWTYGLLYTCLTMESMTRVLGTTFSLDQISGFRKTGWYPIYFAGPVTSLNMGDDDLKTKKEQSYFWFAKHYHDDALARVQYDLCLKNKRLSWMDLLYYDPKQLKTDSIQHQTPTELYFPGTEYMSLRDGWDSDAFFVAMFGKKRFVGHSHLDAGTFFLQAMGEVWAYGNLGSDNYGFPGYFLQPNPRYLDEPSPQKVPGRWHMYRLRAEGKNCLVFNPGVNPDQSDQDTTATIASVIGVPESRFTVDLSNIYKRDVIRYHRTIQLNKTTKAIQVEDDFTTNKPSDVWWSMHTKAKLTISEDGRSVLLQQHGKQLNATIKSPLEARFQVLDASYLPGETFPMSKNSSNRSFRKLVIKLVNQTENSLVVVFSKATS